MSWPWSELGLSGPSDLAAVRQAYSEKLKSTHPEEDPEGFQHLYQAYQEARRLARKGAAPAPQREPEEISGPKEECPPEPEGQPEAEEWNYDRIFAEESRRRAEEQERRMAWRRERFFAKYPAAAPEERQRREHQWVRLEAVLTLIQDLSDSHAPLSEWVDFLYSGAFFSVKGDEEFVDGLEDFLRRTPDLEETVKNELAQAFGLRKRGVPPVWFGLQDLLTGTDHSAPEVTPAPAPVEKKPLWKRWPVRIAIVFLVLLAGIPLAARQIREIRERPRREANARMCQYLEEDLGRRMESLQEGQSYENLFSVWDDPNLVFVARPDGERDLAAGRRGYTTNYGNIVLTRILKEFAAQQGWELDEIDEGGVANIYGGSPGGYIFQVSLSGEEEGVAALGALMESLEEEDWYQVCQPEYTLQLGRYNLTYYTYTSDTPFDRGFLLDYYQNDAGPSFCAYLAEESGLVQEDFGETPWELVPQGAVELEGDRWFLVSGVNADTGETVRQYLYRGMDLTSVPAEEFSLELKEYWLRGGDTFHSPWKDMPRYIHITRK